MSDYAQPEAVKCECGVIAPDHLACGDPCCGRCTHPTWTPPPGWPGVATAAAQRASAENAPQPYLTPDMNTEGGFMVGKGLPPQESPLKRRALPELAEMDDPWDDQ